MHIVHGDLLSLARQGRFDVIVHGCNCMGSMGAGIALAIATQFPQALAADLATAKGDRRKLGTYSAATVPIASGTLTIVNAYTQYHWQGAGVLLDYAALARVMRAVARDFAGRRIGYPRIGAGLAGGDWPRIAAIIDTALAGLDHVCVELAR